jgi:hypothetical protein
LKLTRNSDTITLIKSDILAIKEYRFHDTKTLEETCGWIMVLGILGIVDLPFAIIEGVFVAWLIMEGGIFSISVIPKLICNSQIKYNLKHKWRIVYNNPTNPPEMTKIKP